MMLEISFGLSDAAGDIKNAVGSVLSNGYRTEDIASEGSKIIATSEMQDNVIKSIKTSNKPKTTSQIAV